METETETMDKCAEVSKDFTAYDAAVCIVVNKYIADRIEYGTRTEKAHAESSVLSWSNGIQDWYIWQRQKVNKGDEIKLDANEVLVPYTPEVLEKIKPCLGVLPLYFNSTEAWKRGEIPQAEAQMNWAITQLARINKKEKWVK